MTEVDPTTVPTGFLAAHNDVRNFRTNTIVRAVRNQRADVFVQHVQLPANATTGWHTHPGPAIVTVVDGSFIYQDSHTTQCRNETFTEGQGFVDPGFGHVHRGIAGPSGAHLYVTYILPSGSATHIIGTDPPGPCT